MSNPNVFCLVHLPASWATQTRENIPLVCTMLPFLPCTILKVKHVNWEEAPPHHPIFYIYSVKKKIPINWNEPGLWKKVQQGLQLWLVPQIPDRSPQKRAKIGPACPASLLWRQARKGSPEKRRDISFRLDVSQRRLATNSPDWWARIRPASLFLLQLS